MHTLAPLPYEYNDLEPYIDQETMKIHHTKHHQGYVDKLNETLKDFEDLQGKSIEDLLKNLDDVPSEIRSKVINAGGGHYNHTLFWQMMTPERNEPDEKTKKAINSGFGSFDNFKKIFTDKATTLFGSGWAWLVKKMNTLEVISTQNQDSPISKGYNVLLGIDVWEHAYYLRYQNRRAEYVEAWWNVVNWNKVSELLG